MSKRGFFIFLEEARICWRCTLSNLFIYSAPHLEGFPTTTSHFWREGRVVFDGLCQCRRRPIRVAIYRRVLGQRRAEEGEGKVQELGMAGCEWRIKQQLVRGEKPVRRYEYSTSTLLIRDGS